MPDSLPFRPTRPSGVAGTLTGRSPRVLVAAWIGSNNLGDELIFHALCRKLAAHGVSEVTAVSADPDATRRDHAVRAVSHFDLRALWQATLEADAVIFGGGGLLQDGTSPWNLPYHLSRLWLALALRRPFVALGLGAGPLHREVSRRMVALSLRSHRGLAVRDSDSARLLESIGVRNVELGADLALSLPVVDPTPQHELVVSLRSFTSKGGFLPVGWRTNSGSEVFITQMAQALDQVVEKTGLRVRFVALERNRDHALHQSVAARMSTPCTFAIPSYSNVVQEMARATVVVAMRFHAAVAAVLAGRPQVLIGYAPKVNSLANQLGAGGVCLANEPSAFEILPRAVARVLPHAAEVAASRSQLRQQETVNDRILGRFFEDLHVSSRAR